MPALGPSTIASAIARFSATTGEGFSASRSSYRRSTYGQSVEASSGAAAWQAAMAAST